MNLRNTDTKRIQLSDLRPGDVILSRAPENDSDALGLMDSLILALDEGDYTHAALYVGKNAEDYQVVEGIRAGIVCESVNVDLDAQVLVDVYRFKSPDGKTLGDAGWPAEPVITAAQSLVGGTYSYAELAAIALSLLVTDFNASGKSQIEINEMLGEIIQGLNDYFYEANGKRAMTCVQVVTTAFYEAVSEQPNAYALQANTTVDRNPPVTSDAATQLAHHTNLQKALTQLAAEHGEQVDSAALKSAIQTAQAPFPPVFTPRDLQLSPSLTLVGTLKDETAH